MTFLNNVRKVGRLVLSRTSCYLYGSLKNKAYKRNPHTLYELEENILEKISRTSSTELQCVNHCNARL
jgi:hypothetical protein